MLPAMGFFKEFDCPYYEIGCDRPYCHFRHRKKSLEITEEQTTAATPTDVPTYNPTPKSQLLNTRTHIPISYVPDTNTRTKRSSIRNVPPYSFSIKPTYNPTPLSILSSTSKLNSSLSNENFDSDSDVNKKSKQNALGTSDMEYNPCFSPDIDFEELSTEIDMIDDILSDSNVAGDAIVECKSNVKKDSQCKPVQSKKKSDKLKVSPKRKHENHLDVKMVKLSQEKSKHKLKMPENKTKISESKHKNENRSNGSKDLISRGKPNVQKEKHNSKDKKDHAEKSTISKLKEKSKKKHEKIKDFNEKKEKNHNVEKEKIYKGEKSKKYKDAKEKKHMEGREKHHKEEKEKSHKDDKEKKHKDFKEKNRKEEKDKSSKDLKVKNSKDEKLKNDREEKAKKQKGSKEKEKLPKIESQLASESNLMHSKKVDDNSKDIDSLFNSYSDDDDLNLDNLELDMEDDDTLEECYKIFNEYKPPVPEKQSTPPALEEDFIKEDIFSKSSKKRIAHSKAENTMPKIIHTKSKPIANAAQLMVNRFKTARLSQASNEQAELMAEIHKQSLKRTSDVPVSTTLPKVLKISNAKSVPTTSRKNYSIIDEILSGKSKTKRIAPVQNVMSIQRAKAKIEEMNKLKAAAAVSKTPSQTFGKGGKRLAHIPDMPLSDIPEVLQAERSKLPVNVRSRYLQMLADECAKLYLTKEDAYQRALNEELKCYERCSVLVTYRNVAMLAINRIRKEHQEAERSGSGPLLSTDRRPKGKDYTEELKGHKFYENIKRYVLTEEELDLHGYPQEGPIPGRAVIKTQKPRHSMHLEENERICCRCKKLYLIDDDGFPLYPEDCIYHPLKKRTLRGERTYLCCKTTEDVGCVTSNTHVSDAPNEAEAELEGYQTTMPAESEDDPRNFAVFALDCEMCYTTRGLELTRVTVVDPACKTVYESLVKPLNSIIDYNTRFSGITKEQMDRTSTSILQVQANILHLCNANTILIGHSLESDMKALKIIHNTIVDTSVLFPHKFGLPHKRALRALASEYLKKIIQNDISGHDSAEDALACMELVLWKVKEELKVRGLKVNI